MTPDRSARTPTGPHARRPYEPPAVTEVFVDPARDMLVACAPGKLPSTGTPQCNAVQFT
ncbi:MAG TPA: hypothetical protein VFZ21_00710 [Gemmatimonadaceae bacterium]|jgi:hypothetical protein|nr:hypothetical protein [Gemmatimonadaceae bacterium]